MCRKYTLLVVILVAFVVGSCKRQTTPTPTINLQTATIETTHSMDRVILTALSRLNISATLVQRFANADGVHYQVPLSDFNIIENTERMIQTIVERVDGLENLSTNADTEKMVLSFWDTNESLLFMIELFDLSARPTPQAVTPTTLDRPILAVIIDDFGYYDGPLLDAFNQLDPAVTFAILPGLPFTRTVMQKAASVGREVIVHMPMEADNVNVNPGTNAILSNLSSREIYERVQAYFAEINMASGANQHMGSRITQNRTLMRVVLRYFAERDMFFVDSRTTPNTVAREIARELGIAFAERDLFLDVPENSDEVLADRLRELQRLKETTGRALVITHCFDRGRLQRVQRFIEEAKKQGWEVVPVSKFVTKTLPS